MGKLVISTAEVARRLSTDERKVGEDRVRRVIRKEVAAMVPDEMRMVPGGRVDDNVMIVYAEIFEAVVSGHAVTRTPPMSDESFIHRRSNGSLSD